MKTQHAFERRLQDLEYAIQNMHRPGKITAVRFDKKKKRWFVKMEDGKNADSSGSFGYDDHTMKTDWVPWQSFSHGTIKYSVPPRVGMRGALISPNGLPELAYASPHHYSPDSPSPHDKEDEIVRLVEHAKTEGGEGGGEDKFDHWLRETDNTYHLIIQKQKQQQGGQQSDAAGQGSDEKETPSKTIPQVGEDGDDDTVQLKVDKGNVLGTVGKKAKILLTGDKSLLKFDSAFVELTSDKIRVQFNGDNWIELSGQGITLKGVEIKENP